MDPKGGRELLLRTGPYSPWGMKGTRGQPGEGSDPVGTALTVETPPPVRGVPLPSPLLLLVLLVLVEDREAPAGRGEGRR